MTKMTVKQQAYLQLQTESTQSVYEKAYCGSKANAVKAKCLDCCLNNREEIRFCTVETCPLWAVRPYQLKTRGLDNANQ
jgi:hypothetical protein